ncbi:MAG: PAS domain-containing sensor histidine kinase [Elusimicrobia bacterium]|nr:PAS domain-containing sensor histidine kinase [Elusimicrobiota bacterium]
MPSLSAGPGTDPNEILKTVVGNAPIVLFALDADGIFTLSEGRGLDALGLKPGEVVGRSVFDVYKDSPSVLDACRRALQGETVTRISPVQGLAFETHYAPRLDWGGKVIGMLGVATDVTEPYRCILSKDEFLSVISHELRTPLSSAAGWAYMMREGELSPDETAKALETVCRNLDDLKRLIGELRDASSAATGKLALKVKACDLGAAVREAAESLASAAHAKSQAIEISAPALKAAADKARVRQIAWILLSNAIKYSPKGAIIRARLERDGDAAVLSVSDAGPGLPPSLRGQVFDLTRLPAADLPPRGRGLGLGLSIARRLAELHGGSIDFADGPDGGTVFTVRLPLAPGKTGRKHA